VLCEPLVGRAPVQPPEAVQAVEFAELHVNVVAAPPWMRLCAAPRDAVGGGSAEDEPPPPQEASTSHAAAAGQRIENCMADSVKMVRQLCYEGKRL